MRNADVAVGKAYAWSRHEPGSRDKGAKVTVLALEKIQRDGRNLTMVRVRYDEDYRHWHGAEVPAGTEAHVPARELWGFYEERAARVDAWESRAEEGQRLQAEIIESLVTLGIFPEGATRVFPRVGGGDLGMTVEVRGADEIQRLSDALSFVVSGRS